MTTKTRSKRRNERQTINAKKIALMASTVVFEINKATLKLRRSLHMSPISSPNQSRKIKKDSPESTQSTSRSSKRNRQLCAELSSFALYPIFGALTPSHFSSPNLLFQQEKKPNMSFLELPDNDIQQIMQKLDPESLLKLSHTCRRLRRICEFNELNFPKRDVTSHEIVISFNQIKQKTEVRLLKRERTRYDERFVGPDITCMLPLFSRAVTKITFETSVFVSDWMDEIVKLHQDNRIVPLALYFSGGTLTKGNQFNGADLRSITEEEFIDFVGKLQPHLQEVHLSTSRLFKTSSSPPRLLGMISLLSSFGVIYERPPLRFIFEEVAKVISFWRNDALSRSCDVYMRRPLDANIENWKKIGSIDEYRTDPYTEEILVSKITIKHSFLVHIDLILHFH